MKKSSKYAAFLRGVNIGGHKIIKMQDLSNAFSSLGFKNVKTFIQSGNVVFEALKADVKKIEERLKKSFGFEIKVMIRTIDGLKGIIQYKPFKKIKDADAKLYVMFLSDEPKNVPKDFTIKEVNFFQIRNREAFVSLSKNAKNPFSNNLVEKKLKVSATTRNWNVVRKISEL